jgi:type I restriction enzyme S subunit
MILETVKFGDVLEYEQPTKYIVDSVNYDDSFTIPVLTAGKSFILGYTDETTGVFNDLPVIIFDDFTTAFHYVDFPFKVKSSAMKILKPVKEKADLKYLYYKMQTISIDNDLHKRYWISMYSQIQIPLPPLPQQQKIANILDAADALRQNDKALIAKYDELTQALFLDMFGDPVSSKIIELGEVIKLIGGGTPSKMIDEYWIGTIPWASVKDLKSDLLTSTIDHISEAAIANSATNLIPAGSLIIATRMAVGKAVICLQDTAINQDLKAVKIIGEANVKFLQHLFKSKESYFDSVSSGATVKGIKIEHITKLKVPFPPIELQNQFAKRVAVIEEQKAIAQKSLEKSEELFNSLLQKAFKGELN